MSSLVIVGHGPSMIGANRGAQIDAYDNVCRLKQGSRIRFDAPNDWGMRMDYLCSTLKTARGYDGFSRELKEYWGYENFSGQADQLEELRTKYHCPIRLESDAISYWLGVYRSIADVRLDHTSRASARAKIGDEPWFSTGMGAIVIACASGMFDSINLIGFDTMKLASEIGRDAHSSFKNTFRPAGHIYPPHSWASEAKMVPILSEHYSIPIEFVGA